MNSLMLQQELNLTIDENNLLNEWKGQAALMLDYGIQLADAMQEEDETRAKLSVVAAECEQEVRTDPESFGLTKTTEAAITSTVLMQPEHVAATKRYDQARYAVRLLRAAVDAISHRKSSLQGMTDLFLRQWYADPKSAEQPVELREAARGVPMKSINMRRRRRVHDES